MYDYRVERENVFKENNQALFLGIRDKVHRLLAASGAVTMLKAASLPDGICAADSWTMMACVDRLVELGEIRELMQPHGQERVFVSTGIRI